MGLDSGLFRSFLRYLLDDLAFREYRFIYRRTVVQDIAEICSAAGLGLEDDTVEKLIKEMMQAVSKKVSTHFGQPYLNTATIAGMYRIAMKELAEKLRVPPPAKKQDTGEVPKKPWWYADLTDEP